MRYAIIMYLPPTFRTDSAVSCALREADHATDMLSDTRPRS